MPVKNTGTAPGSPRHDGGSRSVRNVVIKEHYFLEAWNARHRTQQLVSQTHHSSILADCCCLLWVDRQERQRAGKNDATTTDKKSNFEASLTRITLKNGMSKQKPSVCER